MNVELVPAGVWCSVWGSSKDRHPCRPLTPPSHTHCAGEAEDLAQLFNRRLCGGPEWHVHFLPCSVFTVVDPRFVGRRGEVDVLVEHEMEGRFTKWWVGRW
jgi:hypothetical protein